MLGVESVGGRVAIYIYIYLPWQCWGRECWGRVAIYIYIPFPGNAGVESVGGRVAIYIYIPSLAMLG